jgi:hypothetical protein
MEIAAEVVRRVRCSQRWLQPNPCKTAYCLVIRRAWILVLPLHFRTTHSQARLSEPSTIAIEVPIEAESTSTDRAPSHRDANLLNR